MSDPKLASHFLNEHLPDEISQLLAPELPEQVPSSYVDEELSQHHCDLVFRVRLKAGESVLAYVLLEHKSSPDIMTRLQLQRYIVQILAKWYEIRKASPITDRHSPDYEPWKQTLEVIHRIHGAHNYPLF